MLRKIYKWALLPIMVSLFWLGSCPLFLEQAYGSPSAAVVTVSIANVRSGPGTNFSKVGAAKKGARLEIVAQKSGWYKLKISRVITGWIRGDCLAVAAKGTGSSQPKPPILVSTTKIIIISSTFVNVRNGPGVGYAKIGGVNKGQQFKIIAESGGWFKVNLSGKKIGWIIGKFVSVKLVSTPQNKPPIPVPTPKPTPTPVPNPNPITNPTDVSNLVDVTGKFLIIKGNAVNVRSGAGIEYAIVAKVKAEDKYIISKQNLDWYLVDLPEQKQGWVAGWLAEVRSVTSPSRDDNGSSDQPKTDPEGNEGSLPNSDGSDSTPGQDTSVNGNGQDSPGDSESTNTPTSPIKFTGANLERDNDQEKLILRCEGVIKYSVVVMNDPDRLVIDIDNSDLNGLQDISFEGDLVEKARLAQYSLTPMVVRVVLDLNKMVYYKAVLEPDSKTLTISMSEATIKGKTIVVDAGHGEYDPGAIGVTGLEEKEFNLATALLLRDKLTALGATVILTRQDDIFISLTERCLIANAANADGFVAIHANASNSPVLRGTSTYFYAPPTTQRLYSQLQQRKDLAGKVQSQLISQLGTRDIGILQANFAVLRDTFMPSILVESAFLSNPDDEALLKNDAFRNRVAQGVSDGLNDYFGSASQ